MRVDPPLHVQWVNRYSPLALDGPSLYNGGGFHRQSYIYI